MVWTREERNAYSREYHRQNRARCLAVQRVYRLAHRAQTRDRNRTYRLAHREALNAAQRARYAANPIPLREYRKRYESSHPERKVQWQNTRRARRYANGGSHTYDEWRDKCALLGNLCFYCGEGRPLTRDHKVPLIRGGSDDITNILPACRRCNSRKRTMTAQEFLAAGRSA